MKEKSPADLLTELKDDATRLVRDEIALARIEMREKMDVYKKSTRRMAIGGALVLGALGLALIALNRGLTVVLTALMGAQLAVWVAPVALAATLFAIGYPMISSAQHQARDEGIMPHRTIETIRGHRKLARQEATNA